MNAQETTIAALQNRINYLEAHLHLALQVLNEIEKDAQDFSQDVDLQKPHQFMDQAIEIVPTSEVKLPTFLNSRTWKHNHSETTGFQELGDRLVARAS